MWILYLGWSTNTIPKYMIFAGILGSRRHSNLIVEHSLNCWIYIRTGPSRGMNFQSLLGWPTRKEWDNRLCAGLLQTNLKKKITFMQILRNVCVTTRVVVETQLYFSETWVPLKCYYRVWALEQKKWCHLNKQRLGFGRMLQELCRYSKMSESLMRSLGMWVHTLWMLQGKASR